MTRQSQKEEERFYLRDFLSLLLDEVRILDDDRERPDFEVCDVEGHRIGLEVTLYHNDTRIAGAKSLRALEDDWDLLREKINELRNDNPELEKIHGRLSFKKSCFPKKSQIEDLANQIVQCAKKYREGLPKSVDSFADFPLMNECVKSLCLREVACTLSWDSNLRVGWLGIDADSFLNLAKQKVEALKSYCAGQDFDEYWLLIVSGGRISQSIGPSGAAQLLEIPGLDGLLKESKFSRVYLYQFMTSAIYEWPDWKTVREGNYSKPERTEREQQ